MGKGPSEGEAVRASDASLYDASAQRSVSRKQKSAQKRLGRLGTRTQSRILLVKGGKQMSNNNRARRNDRVEGRK